MNDYELMRMSENYDEKIDMSQYTTEQIMEKANSKSKNLFKNQYFDFYDDIKSHTNPKQDW